MEEGAASRGSQRPRRKTPEKTELHPYLIPPPRLMFSLRRGYLRRVALTDELVFIADLPGTPHTPMFLDLEQFTRWPRSNPTSGYFPKWELFCPCPCPPPHKCRNVPSSFLHGSHKRETDKGPQTAGVRREEDGPAMAAAAGTHVHGQDAKQENTGAWAVRFQLWEPRDPPLATDREGRTLPGSPPGMGLEGARLVGCHRQSLS